MTLDKRLTLLRSLSDTRFRSGDELGAALGISRAAVQKHFAALRAEGAPIHSVPGRGYRLEAGTYLLEPDRIRAALPDGVRDHVTDIDFAVSMESTSTHLKSISASASIHGRVAVCEAQTGGRGRRGNRWVASPYRNLMLSVGWHFHSWPAGVTQLALALGTCLAQGLAGEGVDGIGLKWPNDLCVGRDKLGGILIDLMGEHAGPCTAVVGIGINVALTAADRERIDQPCVDLISLLGRSVDRNLLAVVCVAAAIRTLERFAGPGANPLWWRSAWEDLDVLRGNTVEVRGADGTVSGTARGVDASGALVVEDRAGRRHHCYQGDVSVRPAR